MEKVAINGGQKQKNRVMVFSLEEDKAPLLGRGEGSWKIFRPDEADGLFPPFSSPKIGVSHTHSLIRPPRTRSQHDTGRDKNEMSQSRL